jgi:hypothetical protein
MEVQRRDIAVSQKAYQCSTVDDKGPEAVITPPHTGGCRTRREVDPWWEVDLGRTQSVHSVSFTATSTLQQKMSVFVLLLKGPVGFENPFLDDLLRSAVDWKEFAFEECTEVREEARVWVLPEKMFGGAVRIQLRGKNVLRLSRCQVFQGNDLPPQDVQIDFSRPGTDFEADPIGLDEMMRITSFASQPISIFAGIKKENELQTDHPAVKILDIKEKQIETIKRVNVLNGQYLARKARVDWWLDRARDSANFFTIDELMCFRDVLFVPISSGASGGGGARHGGAHSSSKRAIKYVIPTHDLRGNSLMQHFPRCDFEDFIKQLKQIAEWIQNRQHTRDINAFLVAPEKFDVLFHSSNDLFERLGKVYSFMEETWNGSSRAWGGGGTRPATPSDRKAVSMTPVVAGGGGKRGTLLGQSVGADGGGADAGGGAEPQIVDGASWSQVIMMMHLLCLNDVENIPEYVFAVDEGLEMLFPLDYDDSDNDSELSDEQSLGSQKEYSVKSEVVVRTRERDMKAKTLGSPIARRPMSPPPPDATLGRTANMDGRNEGGREGGGGRAGTAGGGDRNSKPGSPSGRAGGTGRDQSQQLTSQLSGLGALSGRPSSPGMASTLPSPGPGLLGAGAGSPPTTGHSAGGRRLASTAPFGMSQLFQLSVLNVARDAKTAAVQAQQKEDTDSQFSDSTLNAKKKKKKPDMPTKGTFSLLESTKDPRMPNLNFEHAQYKLNRLQKNTKFDRKFPKTLDKTFAVESPLARFNLESKKDKKPKTPAKGAFAATAPGSLAGGEGGGDKGEGDAKQGGADAALDGLGSMSWDGDIFGRSMTASENSPNHSFDERDVRGGDSFFQPSGAAAGKGKKKAAVLKFSRSCMLCTQSYPKTAVQNKILLKHIITIRTALDPALANQFAAHLLQGLSPFNLVYVCQICSQFFNPDMPDGVSIPDVQRKNVEEFEADVFGKKKKSSIVTDIFYDDRHPVSTRVEGSASAEDIMAFREHMSLTRSRAKSAIDVARNISEAGSAEEERRVMLEQMEAQIKAGFGGAALRRGSVMPPVKK